MKKLTIALIGNPNSGKTTLFNALTGSSQRVGNWPGVTVDKKTGHFSSSTHHVAVVDLPGIYSLSILSDTLSIDERIAVEYLLSDEADLVVNVLDANNLERNLYLTTQLIELQIPVVLAVNMTDIANKRGISIDVEKLSEMLGCPAIPLISNKKKGILELKHAIFSAYDFPYITHRPIDYSPDITSAIEYLTSQVKSTTTSLTHPYFIAVRLLENDVLAKKKINRELLRQAEKAQSELQSKFHEDVDILIADARFGKIHHLIAQVVERIASMKTTVTSVIDRVVLNRILGIPFFLLVMYAMFFFSINVGGALQPFFDIASNALFVHAPDYFLAKMHMPDWVNSILALGVGKGISTTITFIPVIGMMFLFLSILEETGYMSRAAFVVDRLMCTVGLPGKSFVPMIIGFGCNVPAIMAARTLENQRDRILTVIMSPFMSCGARLAIYAIFTAAFFPKGGQNIVFLLYLIGIIVAIITGFILRKTLLKGEQSNLVMELPPYHFPTIRNLFTETWHRLKCFIVKAGKIIVPVCLLVGILHTVHNPFLISSHQRTGKDSSLLASIGQTVTPIFSPMGIRSENWPAAVGLITGILAKEVVVGTLNTLYAQDQDVELMSKTKSLHLLQDLREATLSIFENFSVLKENLGNPILASAPKQSLDQHVYGQMYERFSGKIGAFAYLLFVLLYLPCIATTAAIFKELNWRWALFSIVWTTGIAYGAAVFFYQAATFGKDPLRSVIWMIAIIIFFAMTFFLMRRFARNK